MDALATHWRGLEIKRRSDVRLRICNAYRPHKCMYKKAVHVLPVWDLIYVQRGSFIKRSHLSHSISANALDTPSKNYLAHYLGVAFRILFAPENSVHLKGRGNQVNGLQLLKQCLWSVC